MTKKPMLILIDDDPITETKMALAKEHHDRTSEFGRLCNAGHVKVAEDNDPINIRCRIEDEYFAEERTRFPSTILMAKLQLAIAAGRSCRNEPKTKEEKAQHQLDAYRYTYGGARDWKHREALMDVYGPVAEAVASGYSNVSEITKEITTKFLTATVKRPKGLRP